MKNVIKHSIVECLESTKDHLKHIKNYHSMKFKQFGHIILL